MTGIAITAIAFLTWQAAKRQTDISEKMANSAQAAIEIQKETMQKANRAYLVIVNPTYEPYLSVQGDTSHRIIYYVKNSGNTFAYSATDSVIFEDRWLSCQPRIPAGTNERNQWVYPPGETKREAFFQQISHRERCGIYGGDFPLRYFSGRIKYSDVFNKEHWLTFCFAMRHLQDSKFYTLGECNDTDKQ